jgi:hypothetical protein
MNYPPPQQITPEADREEPATMPRNIHLPAVLLIAGLILTVVHDYAYRRVDDGSGDYELGGLISHAGSDMLIVVFVLTAIALFWPGDRR